MVASQLTDPKLFVMDSAVFVEKKKRNVNA